MSVTSLKQWGNSMGVRIPKEALEKSKIQTSDILEVIAINGTITLQKKEKKKFSDFVEPLFDTANHKFNREEANER